MDNGWIKLHRRLLENPLMRNPNYRAVWIEILLRASYDTERSVMFDSERIKLNPGQFTTGRKQISEFTGVSESTVERALKSFENEGQIEQRTDRQCRLITVKKWAQYQDDRTTSDTTTGQRVTQRPDTNKEIKKLRNKEPDLATTEVVAAKNEINVVLEAFQMKVNPTTNYGNRTQRGAVQALLNLMGLERLLKTIDYLATIRDEQFAPVITTPYQLKEKLAQLMAYHQKQNNKAPSVLSI